MSLSILIITFASVWAEHPAVEKLANEYRSLPPEHAFYLAAKISGGMLLEGDFEKAKLVWGVYIHEFRRQPYAAPAAVQTALISRLGAGGAEEARRIFEKISEIPGDQLLVASCREIARRWIARDQITTIHAGLKQYYWSHVGYPDKLEKLVLEKFVPPETLHTPWNTRFEYRLVSDELFKDFSDQAYSLGAKEMGPSDRPPQDILQEWVEKLPKYVLWGVAEANGKPQALIGTMEKGSAAGNKTPLVLGEKLDGLKLICADQVGAVLSSDDFVLVLPQRILKNSAE